VGDEESARRWIRARSDGPRPVVKVAVVLGVLRLIAYTFSPARSATSSVLPGTTTPTGLPAISIVSTTDRDTVSISVTSPDT
jgi:hypothetical protein